MQLRSGNTYYTINDSNITKRRCSRRSKDWYRYKNFRNACQDYIGMLNNSGNENDNVCTLHELLTYIGENQHYISLYIKISPNIVSFISSTIRIIPEHIKNLIVSKNNNDLYTALNRMFLMSPVNDDYTTENHNNYMISCCRTLYDLRYALINIIESNS